MTTCDEAAELLIKVLGGEEHTRRVVGGVKWWTVRGVEGVDAQWIATKRDWNDAKKRYDEKIDTPADQSDPTANGSYNENLDEMRCILYFHGGACTILRARNVLTWLRWLFLRQCRPRTIQHPAFRA